VKPTWTQDGKEIVYLSAEQPGGRLAMRTIAASGDQRSWRSAPLNYEPYEVSVGRHLVYSRRVQDTNIYRARISPSGGATAKAETFIASTWRDAFPRYSPDGRKSLSHRPDPAVQKYGFRRRQFESRPAHLFLADHCSVRQTGRPMNSGSLSTRGRKDRRIYLSFRQPAEHRTV
jgi:hypothetical protein